MQVFNIRYFRQGQLLPFGRRLDAFIICGRRWARNMNDFAAFDYIVG